jgi:hypothetical protein
MVLSMRIAANSADGRAICFAIVRCSAYVPHTSRARPALCIEITLRDMGRRNCP